MVPHNLNGCVACDAGNAYEKVGRCATMGAASAYSHVLRPEVIRARVFDDLVSRCDTERPYDSRHAGYSCLRR